MKKSVIRIACFLFILIFVLNYFNKIFKLKNVDGIYDLKIFYELENNTVDVLFLGSSHAFESFNTGTLWDEYGMSSFVLGGSIQPMWNTYYYLKEALKTQTPKLIVLEAYCTIYPNDYMDDIRIITNNFGLKWSTNKLDSLRESVEEKRLAEFLLEYNQYHNRYNDLTKNDFLYHQGTPYYDDWKGFACNMSTTEVEVMDVTNVKEKLPVPNKSEKYYRKIIELAKQKQIPILVTISPYPAIDDKCQAVYNTASDIADEYDVPFINYNLLINELGIDWTNDASDIQHLNYKGNQKFTKAVGKYIAENYDISNHKGDNKYLSWERNATFIRQQIYNQELIETNDIKNFIDKIKNDKYLSFISVNKNYYILNDNYKYLLNELNIDYKNAEGIWHYEKSKNIWNSGLYENELIKTYNKHDFYVNRSKNEIDIYKNKIIIDSIDYTKEEKDINIVIFDTLTEEVLSGFVF